MRNTLTIVYALLCLMLAASCVPQKKLVLLQDKPDKADQANADALLKAFDLQRPIYTLKPGDVLSLKVQTTTPAEYNFLGQATTATTSSDPVLEGYTIDAEGNILIPTVGKVNLQGLTLAEARLKVTEALKPYLTDPTVNMRFLTFRFSVIGEVGSQGQFTTYQDDINLMEAIANAGGFSPYANRGNIKLIRYEAGQAKLYTFSLLDDNTIAQANFYLQPNDMIVVDPLPAKNIRENLIANVSLTLSLIATISVLISRFL
ncbi:polysaccharide biosynthesis/export family protein [Pontibacter sp. BT310]|uniref:Polysaccharide biosynthesis/export family protein n=1 Tax=Pontibacter populi TaxID=890055 RepID=A0ABS6XFE2_9BACT|nr:MULTISPECIES: polysaccharide biosynthesis/export family protein [Pontibacter]MBJ6119779.1 polysaccharide biosynthesis/export family protein [Pontibacter sp. BT310]MBR0572208.1 polysaccharide biosynthesis/export family protein [Microvirga sp. STS03]MBW3366632.1 polysaccharide biosynthesis/export family protein [Pontibacter populi]